MVSDPKVTKLQEIPRFLCQQVILRENYGILLLELRE
jgi:hypothetical protein